MSLAGFAVGLIILVDIATGQGPPGLNSYLGPPVEPFRPPIPLQPIGYLPRGEYDNGKNLNKESYKEGKKDIKYEEGYATTPTPGVLSSFSNSLGDAWKTFTSIGRQKREATDLGQNVKLQGSGKPISSKGSSKARSIEDLTDIKSATSKGRTFDEYELRQFNNHGYIFFKVPKHLVCYS